jgi:UPF0755 protein
MSLRAKQILFALFLILFLVIFDSLFIRAPKDFVPGTIIKIEKGMGLRSVSLLLKEEKVIRSRLLFEALVILLGGEKHIMYSYYVFEDKSPLYAVAYRIARGDRHILQATLTIPEGFSTKEIADLGSSKLINFNRDNFLTITRGKEGYLFPDTYFFFNTDTENDVFTALTQNYEKKVAPLRPEMKKIGKTEKQIITMASLIEGEAKGGTDREIISGILWKRIAIGMALQVDSAPETYKTRGLPKAPISNPGALAIKAAMYPTKSSYLYYLHDKDGNIHYAKTFAEHRQNVLKYLK